MSSPVSSSPHAPAARPPLVIRPGATAWVSASILSVVALALLAVAVLLAGAGVAAEGAGPQDVPSPALITVLTAIGLGFLLLAVVPLRARLIVDATGLHARTALRTRHYPWDEVHGRLWIERVKIHRGFTVHVHRLALATETAEVRLPVARQGLSRRRTARAIDAIHERITSYDPLS
ncbi:PH domain-containing protein [Actinomyces timonensis]|uniref:PH domain-containing protein n=1 Tax=Actinomyces timonensis TaxID=1288391 RepID=A0AAU8N2S9_9ACTO